MTVTGMYAVDPAPPRVSRPAPRHGVVPRA